jgi:hypothetical protein
VHRVDFPEKKIHRMEILPTDYNAPIGELPFQRVLPKEQRSNLHFEHNGPSFETKKKKSTKKITKPVGGGSTFIFG